MTSRSAKPIYLTKAQWGDTSPGNPIMCFCAIKGNLHLRRTGHDGHGASSATPGGRGNQIYNKNLFQ